MLPARSTVGPSVKATAAAISTSWAAAETGITKQNKNKPIPRQIIPRQSSFRWISISSGPEHIISRLLLHGRETRYLWTHPLGQNLQSQPALPHRPSSVVDSH